MRTHLHHYLLSSWILLSIWACEDAAILHTPDNPVTDQTQHALRICAEGTTIRGIDVSEWQGDIDWDAVVADGIKFAFIRASDGNYMDQYFEENWREAERVGLIRGVYQYFRAGVDASTQVQTVLDRIGEIGPMILPPVIDIETLDDESEAQLWARVAQWIEMIESATGVTPIVYTYPYFWRTHAPAGNWSDYPLWIANYEVDCPDVPDDWSRWTFFQYSSTGRVSGIEGNVDLNYFNGTYEALEMLASTPTPCASIPADGATIDTASTCFRLAGPRQYWRLEMGGYNGGSYYWTHATDNAEPVNSAWWSLDFEVSGTYELQLFSAAGAGETQQAPYTVNVGGAATRVVVDQSTVNGWSSLGEFDVEAGGSQWVRLDDNSGELNQDNVRIVADAIRVVPVVTDSIDMSVAPMVDAASMNDDMLLSPSLPLDQGTVIATDAGVDNPDSAQGDDTDSPMLANNSPTAVRSEGSAGCQMQAVPFTWTHAFALCCLLSLLNHRRSRRIFGS